MFEEKFQYLNIQFEDSFESNLFLIIYLLINFMENALKNNWKLFIHC